MLGLPLGSIRKSEKFYLYCHHMCVQINVLFPNNKHFHHTTIVGYFIIMIIVIKYVLMKLNAHNIVVIGYYFVGCAKTLCSRAAATTAT